MRQNALPIAAYLIVVAFGLVMFVAQAPPTVDSILIAGGKTLVVATILGAFTLVVILGKNRFEDGTEVNSAQ